MSDLTELRMNVAALKRVDPYVKDILETATHVALYTFNADNNEWEKTDIEGALFVYSRNGEPYNSILIMNRLNTNNLVEPVMQGLDLQLQEPFLLYRNARCNIYGIWFYDKTECIRIATMLNKLVKESEETRKICNKPLNKSKKNTMGPSNVDIFSMLSKAQEDFNTTRATGSKGIAGGTGGGGIGGGGGSSGNSLIGSGGDIGPKSPSTMDNGPLTLPLGPDVTSQSVMDFFAKAKVNTFKPGDQPSSGSAVNVDESKPLLARLMSHPAAHTVEHIEKQHRSSTPSSHQTSSQACILTTNNDCNVTGASKSKRRNKMNPQQDTHDLQNTTINDDTVEDSSGFLRIQSPTTTTNLSNNHHSLIGTIPLATLLNTHRPPTTTPAKATLQDDIVVSQTLSSAASAPALIPPVMFAAPSPTTTETNVLNRPIEPLTRNQLLQAFNYLLRNDPDFINKLHEAYVKSFSEILS